MDEGALIVFLRDVPLSLPHSGPLLLNTRLRYRRGRQRKWWKGNHQQLLSLFLIHKNIPCFGVSKYQTLLLYDYQVFSCKIAWPQTNQTFFINTCYASDIILRADLGTRSVTFLSSLQQTLYLVLVNKF